MQTNECTLKPADTAYEDSGTDDKYTHTPIIFFISNAWRDRALVSSISLVSKTNVFMFIIGYNHIIKNQMQINENQAKMMEEMKNENGGILENQLDTEQNQNSERTQDKFRLILIASFFINSTLQSSIWFPA